METIKTKAVDAVVTIITEKVEIVTTITAEAVEEVTEIGNQSPYPLGKSRKTMRL
jgi:hypothetical protein